MRTVILMLLQLAVYCGVVMGQQKSKTGFADFVKLVKDEEKIPWQVFKKFVRIDDPELYCQQCGYTGKVVRYGANYTLLYLKQGDGHRAHETIVTYNKQHEQVDAKAFLYFCDPCPKTRVGYFSFVSGNKDFEIKYYLSIGNEMPDPDRIKVLKRERWHITEEGRMVLQ